MLQYVWRKLCFSSPHSPRLSDRLRNGNVKHILPFHYGSPNFMFPSLLVSSPSDRPSAWANLVENENYLNILRELRENCVLLKHHFNLPRLRLHAELLRDSSLLCRRGRMKSKLVLWDICVCARVWVRVFQVHTDTVVAEYTTATAHAGSIKRTNVGDWGWRITHV